jgi:uncharacterized DUF497 family protein
VPDLAVYYSPYYTVTMAVDWSHRSEYINAKHGVTTEQANEALADAAAVVIDPDPASISGKSTRTIGYSASLGDILTVITVEDEGITCGSNAWAANDRDRRTYRERNRPE